MGACKAKISLEYDDGTHGWNSGAGGGESPGSRRGEALGATPRLGAIAPPPLSSGLQDLPPGMLVCKMGAKKNGGG